MINLIIKVLFISILINVNSYSNSQEEESDKLREVCVGLVYEVKTINKDNLNSWSYLSGYTAGALEMAEKSVKDKYRNQSYNLTIKEVCKKALDMDTVMRKEYNDFRTAYAIKLHEVTLK